jgi:glycosyltransferase involved in cell wall biosynthesis
MCDEEDTAGAFCARVRAVLGDVPFELIVVDDGSRDRTAGIVAGLAAIDPRVKLLRLSRNWGHQTALTAGLDRASGDAVVCLDGDLQDPPEVIGELLERWRAGADVVYAVRRSRAGESRFKLSSARWFYRTLGRLSDTPVQADAGDFRLLDRRALDAVLAMRERNRYLRGMTVWVGYDQASVAYDREARTAGSTKYTVRRMLRFSFDAITSFSHAPLQVATLLGFCFAGIAFLGMPVAIGLRIGGLFVPGIASVLLAVLLLGGIQLIAVGLIGEYVSRIYDEVKARPLYLVAEEINLEPRDALPEPEDPRIGAIP